MEKLAWEDVAELSAKIAEKVNTAAAGGGGTWIMQITHLRMILPVRQGPDGRDYVPSGEAVPGDRTRELVIRKPDD
jgi:hypothetical protein